MGHIMLDLEGHSLSQLDKEILQHPQVGGIILFARNYESKKQLQSLTREIRKISPECLIAVDQEGGRVQRFVKDFTTLPSFEEYGLLFEKNPDAATSKAEEMAYVMARELQEAGVNISFTPVLDLDYKKSEVIGTRSFHADPIAVSKLANAFIDGMHQAGMPATGKHFPGHGAVAADSHLTLPIDERDYDSIYEQDMQPFLKLNNKLDAIMPAHILYQSVDHNPTCFSNVWLQDILRKQLDYQGVIFSDDLGMAGANFISDEKDRAKLALEAGCDMILICNNRNSAISILDETENYSNNISAKRLTEFNNKCKR